MSILLETIIDKILKRAIKMARAEADTKKLKPDDLVIIGEDPSLIFDILYISTKTAVLAPSENGEVDHKNQIKVALEELTKVRDVYKKLQLLMDRQIKEMEERQQKKRNGY